MMNIAASAYEIQVIMIFIKSLRPGASMMVMTDFFACSNFQRAISIVIPLSF